MGPLALSVRGAEISLAAGLRRGHLQKRFLDDFAEPVPVLTERVGESGLEGGASTGGIEIGHAEG